MYHNECYGKMFPGDLVRPRMHRRVDGKVFGYEQTSAGGFGIATQETFLNQKEWDDCLACEEFDHCYKLSLARLAFDHAIGR